MSSGKMHSLCVFQVLYDKLAQMENFMSLSEMQLEQFQVFNKLKLFMPSLSMTQVLKLMLMTHEQMDEFLLDNHLEELQRKESPVERLMYLLEGQLNQTVYELIAKPTLKCLRIQVNRCYDFSQIVHDYLSQQEEKPEHSYLALAMRQCLVDLMLYKLDFAIRQGNKPEQSKKKKLSLKHGMIQKLDELTKLQQEILNGIDTNDLDDQQRELLNGLKLKRTPFFELDNITFTLLFGEVVESDYRRCVVDGLLSQ